jgi:hypothetical protein
LKSYGGSRQTTRFYARQARPVEATFDGTL